MPTWADDEPEAELESNRKTVMHSKEALLGLVTRLESLVPCLVAVQGHRSTGAIFPLHGEMVIGRAIGVDVQLHEDGISRRHAKIRVAANGDVEVEDLGSSNGTFFNGERIARQQLSDGDRVQVGNAVLVLLHMETLDEAQQQSFRDAATREPVSRLFTRRHFVAEVRREFAYALREESSMSVLLVGIDRLARIGDRFGQSAVDTIVRRAASTLSEHLQESTELLARYGEDQFALVLLDVSPAEVVTCVSWIDRCMRSLSVVLDHATVPITASIGVATLAKAQHRTADDLLDAAEHSLLSARVARRARAG